MQKTLVKTIIGLSLLTILSGCQVTGKATDILLPGVDVEVGTDGSGQTDSGKVKDNNGAWEDGEHCPPGQEKKGKCTTSN